MGDAARAVKDLVHSNGDYVEAIKVVHARHGNQQIIVNSHTEELTKVTESRLNADTVKSRELYAESNLRSLDACGTEGEE